jgi:hypothetical protein
MKVYTVETKDTIFWSERKMDATYKHVEFLYGQAKFGEINKADLLKKGKKVIQIQLEGVHNGS